MSLVPYRAHILPVSGIESPENREGYIFMFFRVGIRQDMHLQWHAPTINAAIEYRMMSCNNDVFAMGIMDGLFQVLQKFLPVEHIAIGVGCFGLGIGMHPPG